MDRRTFLWSTAAMAASGFAAGTKLHAQAPAAGINSMLVAQATAAHIATIANTYGGALQPADWINAGATTTALAQNVLAVGYDPIVRSVAAQVSPAQLDPALVNRDAIVAAVQVYQPTFTRAHLDTYMESVVQTPGQLTQALYYLRANGVSPLLASHATQCAQIAAWLQTHQANAMFGSAAKPGGMIAPAPDVNLRPNKPLQPEPGGGTGGYNCADDGMASIAAATIFVTLGIMAAPALAGVLVGGAALDLFINIGGAAAGAWGLGHSMECNF